MLRVIITANNAGFNYFNLLGDTIAPNAFLKNGVSNFGWIAQLGAALEDVLHTNGYVFSGGDGSDVITDFSDGEDQIVFRDLEIFQDLNIMQQGSDVLINWGIADHSILLLSINTQ